MQAISLENLNYYINYFNKLKKAGLTFDIEKTEKYVSYPVGSYHQLGFIARFKNLKDIKDLSTVWATSPTTLTLDSFNSFTGYAAVRDATCAIKVTESLYRKDNSAIKFYAGSVFDNNNLKVRIYLLDKPVPEIVHDNHTYRVCTTLGVYNSGDLIYCGDPNSSGYNYVDKGHVIVYVSTGENSDNGSRMFITDNLTLDMNYIVAAASVYPPAIEEVWQHKSWLPSKDCRMQLLRMEKVIPAKLRPDYLKLKQQITDDYSKNTASVMIGKLTRKESPVIELNNIKITNKKADYVAGRVSIEAPNLAEVVFTRLNPNETEWDIFTLIHIYTDWVNGQFKNLPLNAEETGFQAAKEFEFKINNIPLKVGCSTENTRRTINGHLINVDELSQVLRRASCYQPVDEGKPDEHIKSFDKFISNVSRYSLKIRDVWANGLPVKTVFLESDRSSWQKPATLKHPKLRFILKDKKGERGFYLQVPQLEAKTNKVLSKNEYHISKFAEFVKKVDQANRSSYMYGYSGNYVQTAEGFYVPNNGTANPMSTKLNELLGIYAAGITAEDRKSIVGVINYELSEAEKRSEELLKEACSLTKAKNGEREGKKGFVIPGKLRTYFIEEEPPFKVWDNNPKTGSNAYVCIVSQGEQGVGKDELVARMFAVFNDEMMAKQIHTLKQT